MLDPLSLAGDVQLDALGSRAVQVVAGGTHTCALLEGGRVRCWGDGEYGQLGTGGTLDVLDPLGASLADGSPRFMVRFSRKGPTIRCKETADCISRLSLPPNPRRILNEGPGALVLPRTSAWLLPDSLSSMHLSGPSCDAAT